MANHTVYQNKQEPTGLYKTHLDTVSCLEIKAILYNLLQQDKFNIICRCFLLNAMIFFICLHPHELDPKCVDFRIG